MSTFCPETIKELRIKNGMSQNALGKSLGISNRAVSKWENGLSLPSAEHVFALSKIFNVPMDCFYRQPRASTVRTTLPGMESVAELYKIGSGPSSSHTIGPEKACRIFRAKNLRANAFKVVLYGSLAKTGKGHGTDTVIRKTLSPCPCEIEFNFTESDLPHPNTMLLIALRDGQEISRARVCSVGGGSILFENAPAEQRKRIYPHSKFSDIAAYCDSRSIRLWEYVEEYESPEFALYMESVWKTMKESIERGLRDEGILPGGLELQKKAKTLYNNQHIDESAETREGRMVCSYAFAVSEQNASGETIVTAPTCGSAGVLPAVLYYQQKKHSFSDDQIIHALMTAGVIGNLIKTNASISGAECGCQAEIGSACAMAAAALSELFGVELA